MARSDIDALKESYPVSPDVEKMNSKGNPASAVINNPEKLRKLREAVGIICQEGRMSKTKIEWCDYSVNPVKGLCPVACSYCYARLMYNRFKWNPDVRMEPDWMEEMPKKPAKIFVGSTMELFGDWVEEWMWKEIWTYINSYPQHTFIFLTKRPENLIKWSPFPNNVWVGVSAPNASDAVKANKYMAKVDASVKFLSIEPMHDWNLFPDTLRSIFRDYQWLIIGQQTPMKASTSPKLGQIQDILVAADNPLRIPVFMKNNLKPLLVGRWAGWKLRQESPR